MAPKTLVKQKAMTATLFSASSRKKQWISLESVTSLPAGNETVTSATGSPGAEEPTAMEGTSAAGPTTGLESTEVAGPSSGGEGTSVAGAGSVEMSVGRGLSSRVGKKQAQRWRISVVLVARKLLLRLPLLILLQGPLKTF